ncbi:MULE domain-containing protein [Aphis craccivora]|uniref:MULE domain-containing protein n=1 Tax=Aphis craccivora TaxID=307492 RepID=A0A6G0ZJ65_APHCR|nr:MULE domain-containing protein [Aphis craccivora]
MIKEEPEGGTKPPIAPLITTTGVKHFLQLFTIHGYLNGHYVPLCFFVLKDKHVSTYSEYFKIINEICSSYGFVFEPKEIIIDIEKEIHNACDLI